MESEAVGLWREGPLWRPIAVWPGLCLLLWLVIGGSAARADPIVDRFLADLEAGNPSDCPYCDLKGRNLAGKDLTDANLQAANLSGANLQRAKLDGAVLARADLSGADLTGASLLSTAKGPVDLTAADVTRATFVGAKFLDTDFSYARLACADFGNTDSTKAVFSPFPDFAPLVGETCRTSFRDAVVGCEFRRHWNDADLSGVTLPDCAPDDDAPEAGTVGDGVTQSSVTVYGGTSASASCGGADLTGLKSKVYVSTDGNDAAGCGTSIAKACKTIDRGIKACTGAGCGVLVHYGAYTPAASIGLRAGIDVYGGCLFSNAADDTQYYSLVTAPPDGVSAFRADGLTTAARLSGFKVMASPTTTPSWATAAITVSGSKALTISESRLYAAQGAVGGASGAGATGQAGGSGNGIGGGSNSHCAAGPGGRGGNGWRTSSIKNHVFKYTCHFTCSGGCDGQNASYSSGTFGQGGKQGRNECGNFCAHHPSAGGGSGGHDGANGACSDGGRANPNTKGLFVKGLYSPAQGKSGAVGGHGLGGGGGGGGGACAGENCIGKKHEWTGNYGSGGGAGGCGGAGGPGGWQGGGSFGLIAVGSTFSVADVTLVGGLGGKGSQGGRGGAGGGGGGSGGLQSDHNCRGAGGKGGAGGIGGFGGSGGGGRRRQRRAGCRHRPGRGQQALRHARRLHGQGRARWARRDRRPGHHRPRPALHLQQCQLHRRHRHNRGGGGHRGLLTGHRATPARARRRSGRSLPALPRDRGLAAGRAVSASFRRSCAARSRAGGFRVRPGSREPGSETGARGRAAGAPARSWAEGGSRSRTRT